MVKVSDNDYLCIRMLNTEQTHKTNKLLKWLFAAGLVLSIFTLSDYIGNLTALPQNVIKTECVFSHTHKTTKRTIAYQRALASIPSKATFLFVNWTDALLVQNTLNYVALKTVSSTCYFQLIEKHFLQVSSIPESSDEDIFKIKIG